MITPKAQVRKMQIIYITNLRNRKSNTLFPLQIPDPLISFKDKANIFCGDMRTVLLCQQEPL